MRQKDELKLLEYWLGTGNISEIPKNLKSHITEEERTFLLVKIKNSGNLTLKDINDYKIRLKTLIQNSFWNKLKLNIISKVIISITFLILGLILGWILSK